MHKRARKAEILILVMMPKLLIKRANTPKTIPLKISRGRTILFPVLIDTTTPLAMKNNSSHQASTSGTENRCLSFVKVHGKGPRRTPTKDHKEFFTNVTGLSSPVFITTEELCPRLFFTAGRRFSGEPGCCIRQPCCPTSGVLASVSAYSIF